MATPVNTPSPTQIQQLSIDDLLAPLPEKPRLGGPGPFVINLSASTVPISPPVTGIAGRQHLYAYQVQRMEDRRLRYRLRLGPFADEDEADAILGKVREIYPGAFTATADPDDLRAIGAVRTKADAPKSAAEKPDEDSVPTLPLHAATSRPVSVTGTATLPERSAAIPTLPVAAPPAPPRPLPASAHSVPARIPSTTLAPKAPAPAAESGRAASQPIQALAAAPGPVRHGEQINKQVPGVETTQTVRPLTSLELEQDRASRWFVIQLSLAAHAFDPDTLPNLDIFSAYRLYSVAGLDQGRVVHALRLGFFSDEIAARAVASYVAAHYDKPTVRRVSAAEHERFAEQRFEPRKEVGATGKHAVIEITSERFIRHNRIAGAV